MPFETICPLSFKKPRRRVDRVFIHCSAARRANVTAEEVDLWHRQRGWECIGYHYFIRTNGILEGGRGLGKTPAAQASNNGRTIAICLNGLMVRDFTDAQFDTLELLCHVINNKYNGEITFHGHNEVSAKACPVFDYKAVLGLSDSGVLPFMPLISLEDDF